MEIREKANELFRINKIKNTDSHVQTSLVASCQKSSFFVFSNTPCSILTLYYLTFYSYSFSNIYQLGRAKFEFDVWVVSVYEIICFKCYLQKLVFIIKQI